LPSADPQKSHNPSALPPLPEVRLTLSPYTEDYTVCWAERCAPLHTLVHAADIATVTLRPCG